MQAAVNKAIQVGRATMLAIGAGVVLALVLGVATVALAAVPGDPFRLGQVNVISNATTALQGTAPNGSALLHLQRTSGIGAVLKVEATNQGLARRGIDITVPPGQSPIIVNSDAGKSNLNVNLLDGKDQTDFLSASRIYKVGNTVAKEGPGNGGNVSITSFPSATDGLACDDGDVAIGAGGRSTDINDDLNSVVPASSNSYHITFQDNDSKSSFFGFVLCSDSSHPFRE